MILFEVLAILLAGGTVFGTGFFFGHRAGDRKAITLVDELKSQKQELKIELSERRAEIESLRNDNALVHKLLVDTQSQNTRPH